MNLFTPGNNICKTLVIPPVGSIVSDVATTVQIPADLSVVSATPSLGSYLNGVWTIPALPCGVEASLELCFGYADPNTCPTSKELSANITTTTLDTNLNNNQVDITLDYITCCDLSECTPTEELVSVECYTEGGENLACDGTDNAQNTLQYTPPVDVVVDDIILLSSVAGADAPALDIFEGGVLLAGSNNTVAMDSVATENTWFFNSVLLTGGTTYTFEFSNPDVLVCWADSPPQDGFVIQGGGSFAPNKYPLVGVNGFIPSVIPAIEYSVITYIDEGVVRIESVLTGDPYTRTDITSSGIPATWEPCVVGGISQDAGQGLTLGSDGLPLYVPPTPGPVVSGDAGNDLTEGSDNAPYFNHTPSTITNNGDGTYTHDNGVGGTQDIGYSLDGSGIAVDGILDLVDVDGNVISEVNVCNGCPTQPTASDAPDIEITVDECGRYYGRIDGASCSPGNPVIKLVPNTSVNGVAHVGAGGEFWFEFDNCATTDAMFAYTIDCGDGVQATGMVNLTLPTLTATATDDQYATASNTSMSGNVAANDVLCDGGSTTTFELVTPPTNGSAVLQPDGSFVYIPSTNFAGVDTFTYNIVCNGVIIASQADVTITVIDASANDDYFVGVKDTSLTGVDVSTNDSGCNPGAVTTYQWKNGTTTVYGGTVSGTPDNATYTPPTGFCGVDAMTYELLCDGIVFPEATAYFSISCGAAVGDGFSSLLINTPFEGGVSDNDFTCTNGGMTSYHLVEDDTLNGAVVAGTEDCDSGITINDVTITTWDQNTGNFTISPTNDWFGTACFQYFIRCTSPGGDTYDTAPATTVFEVVPVEPVAYVMSEGPNDTEFTLTFGSKFTQGGVAIPLALGDTVRIEILEIGVDVEWIVGGDISSPAGVTNDNGTVSWFDVVAASSFPAGSIPSPGDLLTNVFKINFDKYVFADNAGLIGLGLGEDYTWTITNENNGLSDTDTTAVKTLFTGMEIRTGGSSTPAFLPICGHSHGEQLAIYGTDKITPAEIELTADVVVVGYTIDGTNETPIPTATPLLAGAINKQWFSCNSYRNTMVNHSATFEIIDPGVNWASPLAGLTLSSNTSHDHAGLAFGTIRGDVGRNVVDPCVRQLGDVNMFFRRVNNTDPIREVNVYIATSPGGNPLSGVQYQAPSFNNNTNQNQQFFFASPVYPQDGVYPWYSEIILEDGSIQSSQEGRVLIVSY